MNCPAFDGTPSKFESYQYAAKSLKSQSSPKDYKFLAPKLIASFTGQIKDNFRNIEMDISKFANPGGVEQLLSFLKERLHIPDYSFEVKVFEGFFHSSERKHGETMTKCKNDQEASYRKLQSVLNEAMRNGEDEYSDDDMPTSSITTKDGKHVPKIKHPKRP